MFNKTNCVFKVNFGGKSLFTILCLHSMEIIKVIHITEGDAHSRKQDIFNQSIKIENHLNHTPFNNPLLLLNSRKGSPRQPGPLNVSTHVTAVNFDSVSNLFSCFAFKKVYSL